MTKFLILSLLLISVTTSVQVSTNEVAGGGAGASLLPSLTWDNVHVTIDSAHRDRHDSGWRPSSNSWHHDGAEGGGW